MARLLETRLVGNVVAVLPLVAVLLVSARLDAQDRKTDAKTEEIKRILESSGATLPGKGRGANLLSLPPVKVERKTDPRAMAIIENHLEKIGGRETLAAIQDRTTKFNNLKYSATGETKAILGLYLKRGYKYREEWLIPDFPIGDKPLAFVQIYNGDLEEGWVKMFDTVSQLEGRTLGVFVWDKYIDSFFINMEQDGFTATMAGRGLVDDEPADILQVVDFSGRHRVRYFFSNSSGLLVKKEWMDTSQREPAKKEQYYRKYTRIAFSDGSKRTLRFPLHHEIMVDGDLDTERLYTTVKINSNLNDKLFAKPEGQPFEKRKRFGSTTETVDSKGAVPNAKATHPVLTGVKSEGSDKRRRAPLRKDTGTPAKTSDGSKTPE